MGTLGCVNDMLRRDKENRELRRQGCERLGETRKRLLDVRKNGNPSLECPENLEEIARLTHEREETERNRFFRFKLLFFAAIALAVLLLLTVFYFISR